jgi:hypothetical protein
VDITSRLLTRCLELTSPKHDFVDAPNESQFQCKQDGWLRGSGVLTTVPNISTHRVKAPGQQAMKKRIYRGTVANHSHSDIVAFPVTRSGDCCVSFSLNLYTLGYPTCTILSSALVRLHCRPVFEVRRVPNPALACCVRSNPWNCTTMKSPRETSGTRAFSSPVELRLRTSGFETVVPQRSS